MLDKDKYQVKFHQNNLQMLKKVKGFKNHRKFKIRLKAQAFQKINHQEDFRSHKAKNLHLNIHT